MPFVYVAGVAGSGKSAVCEMLQSRGVTAYDEDAPSVGAAHNKASGESVSVPSAAQRTSEWFATHEWRILDSALARITSEAQTKLVVLCGNSLSDAQLSVFRAAVLYLRIDTATLHRRLAERADNDYGKSEAELNEIMERHRLMDERFLPMATVIDATKPLDQVVAEIVERL